MSRIGKVLGWILLCSAVSAQVQDDALESPMDWKEAAGKLAHEGKYPEALALYLRCFDEGTNDPEFAGVRVSFLLSDIKSLAAHYPEAMDRLRERRDAARIRWSSAAETTSATLALMELVALNDTLGDKAENLKIYDELRGGNQDERLLRIVERRVEDELLARGDLPRKSSRAQARVNEPGFLQSYRPYHPKPKGAESLGDRWNRTIMEVARVSVDLDTSFHRSMSHWQNSSQASGMAAMILSGAGGEVIQFEGDVLEDIESGRRNVVHVVGDVFARITASGQSEIVIAGDLKPNGSIYTDGIARIFIGGRLEGEIAGSSSTVIIVQGSVTGTIKAGTPSTRVSVQGDFEGTIEPLGSAAMFFLTVNGSMSSQAIQSAAAHDWTQFKASIRQSDLAPGLYPKSIDPHRIQFVIHSSASR